MRVTLNYYSPLTDQRWTHMNGVYDGEGINAVAQAAAEKFPEIIVFFTTDEPTTDLWREPWPSMV